MGRFESLKWYGILLLLLTSAANAQVNYALGVGDEIRLTVYGQPELSTEGQINNDGYMEIPLIGSVKIAGNSSGDLAKLIAERYRGGNVLKTAQVNVYITKYRSQVVSLLGKFNHPGRLVLEGPTSLTQAVAYGGGVSDAGSERLILVRTDANGRQERREYDLQKILNSDANATSVVWLQNGDTLYVPLAGRYYVTGEVRAGGMFALDRPLNVMQALGVAGGVTARASERSIKLFRKQTDGSTKEIRAKPEDAVMDGDVLVVQESLF